jgi:hypothetical protein
MSPQGDSRLSRFFNASADFAPQLLPAGDMKHPHHSLRNGDAAWMEAPVS